jgi:hypothetical protein
MLVFFSSKVDMHNMPLERVLFHDTFLQDYCLLIVGDNHACPSDQ